MLGRNKNIYKVNKAKQVSIYRIKEKKIFIAILIIDLGGKILAIQKALKINLVVNLHIPKAFKEIIKNKY